MGSNEIRTLQEGFLCTTSRCGGQVTFIVRSVLYHLTFSANNFLYFRSPREVEEFRSANEITLRGKNVPLPIKHFREAGFPDYVLREMK